MYSLVDGLVPGGSGGSGLHSLDGRWLSLIRPHRATWNPFPADPQPQTRSQGLPARPHSVRESCPQQNQASQTCTCCALCQEHPPSLISSLCRSRSFYGLREPHPGPCLCRVPPSLLLLWLMTILTSPRAGVDLVLCIPGPSPDLIQRRHQEQMIVR